MNGRHSMTKAWRIVRTVASACPRSWQAVSCPVQDLLRSGRTSRRSERENVLAYQFDGDLATSPGGGPPA